MDNELEEIYEMGPTIQENNALEATKYFGKNHTLKITVKIMGDEKVMEVINPNDREWAS